jgi:hypothetical protein
VSVSRGRAPTSHAVLPRQTLVPVAVVTALLYANFLIDRVLRGFDGSPAPCGPDQLRRAAWVTVGVGGVALCMGIHGSRATSPSA